jgi:hypothetical protein
VKSYFDLLGLPKNVISFADFSEESLLAQLKYGWLNRGSIRERLREVIPVLSRETAKSAEIIAAIDRGEDIRTTIRRLKDEGQFALAAC